MVGVTAADRECRDVGDGTDRQDPRLEEVLQLRRTVQMAKAVHRGREALPDPFRRGLARVQPRPAKIGLIEPQEHTGEAERLQAIAMVSVQICEIVT